VFRKKNSELIIGEFDYAPNQIGRRVSVSSDTIKRRLEKTGLIDDCYRDEKGWLRIPYSVAVELIGEKAMQAPLPAPAKSIPKRRQFPTTQGRRRRKREFVEDESDDFDRLNTADFKDRDSGRGRALDRKSPAQAFRERQEYFEELARQMFKAGITPEMIHAQVAKNFEEYLRKTYPQNYPQNPSGGKQTEQ